MKSSTSYLSSSVLVGLLKHEGCRPNLINALNLSKEAGIKVIFVNSCGECVILENLTCAPTLQVSQSHCEANGAVGVCHVEVVTSSCSYKAIGAVQGGTPVLLELCGSVFRQPVSLAGSLLFFKAPAKPQLLSSVAGKNVMQSCSLGLRILSGESILGLTVCLRRKMLWINPTYLSLHRPLQVSNYIRTTTK